MSPAINGLGADKTGFGYIIVEVPANASAGKYPYTITVTSGNTTSGISNVIVVV